MIYKLYRMLIGLLLCNYVFSFHAHATIAIADEVADINYVKPATYEIEAIQVTGTKQLDPAIICAIVGLKQGDTIRVPGHTIQNAIQRLWKQKLIKDVKIYVSSLVKNRIVLTIAITENTRIASYCFQGITKAEEKTLIEQLNLIQGEVLIEGVIKHTKQVIQNYWIEKGFLNVVVTILPLPDPELADYTQLQIHIDKGKKYKIRTIHIQGNEHITSHVIKNVMQSIQEQPRFTLVKDLFKHIGMLYPLRKGGVLWKLPSLSAAVAYIKQRVILFPSRFIQAKYQEDKKRIIDLYRQQGFQDAKIVEEACYKHDGYVDLYLKIEEGEPYCIKHITWVGNYIHDEAKLTQLLGIHKGDLYNPILIKQALNGKINYLYTSQGYLFFRAELVEVGVVGHEVALEIRLYEGPQAVIRKINISGNRYTYDHVIQRALSILPGEKYNLVKIHRSMRNLAMLGIFDISKLDLKPIPNPTDGTVDLLYKVTEKPEFRLNLLGNYNAQGLVGTLQFGVNNFSLRNLLRLKKWPPLGELQTINLAISSKGKHYQDFSFHFIEPWLGGKKPINLEIQFNKSHQVVSNKNIVQDNYIEAMMLPFGEYKSQSGSIRSTGLSLGLGTRLTWPDDYCKLQGHINYTHYRYNAINLLGNAKKGCGSIYDFHISACIERLSINELIYPTEGSIIVLYAGLTPPYSLFSTKDYSKISKQEKYKFKEYHKWTLDVSYFFKLVGNLVLNLRSNIGLLGGFSEKLGVGPFDRFVVGGGLLEETALLLGNQQVPIRGYEDKDVKGSVLYNKFVCELRYPLVNSSLMSIYTLAFAEAGGGWLYVNAYNLRELKKSVGLGVRIHLPVPIFPMLGLDWGYSFDQPNPSQNNKIVFQFSMNIPVQYNK